MFVAVGDISLTVLGGGFSAMQVKNARKYIQYFLCFLPLPNEKSSRRYPQPDAPNGYGSAIFQ